MSAPTGSECVVWLSVVLLTSFQPCNGDEHHIASKVKSEHKEIKRCGYNLKILWQAEVGYSPFAASPLLADVDGDGVTDVIAAPFSEALTVLNGENGKTLENSCWPSQNLENSIHSSPLQYDIDGDGMLDILFVMSSGELKFFKYDGTHMPQYTYQLPPVYVLKDWHEKVLYAGHDEIHQYIADHVTKTSAYLPVDPHVYATPALADLNRDGRLEELVLPVTYFFDEEDYRTPEKQQHLKYLKIPHFSRYLVDGVSVLNLTSLEPLRHVYLDLTQVYAQFPAFALFSPTVIDLDSNGSDLEVLLATSAGNLHVLDKFGHQRKGFPKNMNSLHGQVTVEDINRDGKLEIIGIDTSGNVVCVDRDGTTLWEGEVTGSSSPGSRITDVNQDGILDVIIATSDGNVYALNGTNGKSLPKWPMKFGTRIAGNILLTKIGSTDHNIDLVFVADDSNLYFVSGDQMCQAHLPLGENSLVEIVSHELIQMSRGLELLVSTNDGTLFCLGTGVELLPREWIEETWYQGIQLLAWPAVTKTANDFTVHDQKTGVYIASSTRNLVEVTGGSFWLQYEVIESAGPTSPFLKQAPYTIQVYYGKHLLAAEQQSEPGIYILKVPVWPVPGRGHVTVVLTNQHGQIFKDIFPLKFNQLILQDLQWLVLAPFVAMATILLVNHGFPAKDLLPMTFPAKAK
ncbi:uncharacterized protein [Haliotis asinina]|uniref:uncharacterized protein n=1 Tax=Haliotis asinina TaxID=109174 RepID=UPI003531AE5C